MDKLICLIVSTIVMVAAQGALFFGLSEFRFDRRKVKIIAVILGARDVLDLYRCFHPQQLRP